MRATPSSLLSFIIAISVATCMVSSAFKHGYAPYGRVEGLPSYARNGSARGSIVIVATPIACIGGTVTKLRAGCVAIACRVLSVVGFVFLLIYAAAVGGTRFRGFISTWAAAGTVGSH